MKYAIVIHEGANHSTYHQGLDDNTHISKRIKKIIKELLPDISKTYRIENNRVCKIIDEFKQNYIHYICVDLLNGNSGIIGDGALLFYDENNKKRFFDRIFNK